MVEPDLHDEDVEYVLEFANAQLLELRVFDALLDAELPRMYDRVAAVRTASPIQVARPYRRLLAELQTLVGDVTDIIERAENAFKVTDDVYLARVYSAALEIFRGAAWRRGIDRKLGHHAGDLRDAQRRVTGGASGGAGDLHRVAHRAGGGAVVRPRLALEEPYEGNHR